jgi:hypothetical protein
MRKPAIRKISAVAVLVSAFSLFALAEEKSIASVWAASPLTIDGLVKDWNEDPFHVEKKVKVEYACRNDSDTLYVLFIFNDDKYLSSIDMTGMTIWVDTKGKKGKNLGIKFSKKRISADEFIAILENQKGAVSDERKESLRAREFYFISHAEAVDKKGNPIEQDGGSAQSAGFDGASPPGLTALRKMSKKYSVWTVVRLAEVTESRGGY